jgi:hypothetical protein
MSWPFMSTIDQHEALRQRVIELLTREQRAMHTGELAGLLQVKTHQIQTAMHSAHQTGKVWFVSSEGWSLPPALRSEPVEGQERLA